MLMSIVTILYVLISLTSLSSYHLNAKTQSRKIEQIGVLMDEEDATWCLDFNYIEIQSINYPSRTLDSGKTQSNHTYTILELCTKG